MAGHSANVLIGIHSVDSALSNMPGQVRVVRIAQESHNPRVRKLANLAGELGIPVAMEPRALLERRSEGQRHQDIIAEFAAENLLSEKDLDRVLDSIDGPPLLLVLDGVQDPHNLGACLRSADAAGADAVIVPQRRAVGLTPAVHKAACGATQRVPLVTVANLAQALRRLARAGVTLFGAGAGTGIAYTDAEFVGPLAMVLGGEGRGLRTLPAELCDQLIHVPMRAGVESLNVSVAAALCLYEARRQRAEAEGK